MQLKITWYWPFKEIFAQIHHDQVEKFGAREFRGLMIFEKDYNVDKWIRDREDKKEFKCVLLKKKWYGEFSLFVGYTAG